MAIINPTEPTDGHSIGKFGPEQISRPKVHLKIVHRFQDSGSDCLPGEEIASVYVVHGGREFHLKLSLALRILLDYLARHRWLPQTAAQIEAGVGCDVFCLKHGANASGRQTRKISRAAVKEYIKRIRQAMSMAFGEAGLNLDPAKVLVSEQTFGGGVLYRLKASVELIHAD